MQAPQEAVAFVALLERPRTGPQRMGRSRQLPGYRGRLPATELGGHIDADCRLAPDERGGGSGA
jgi:hypothetical protein